MQVVQGQRCWGVVCCEITLHRAMQAAIMNAYLCVVCVPMHNGLGAFTPKWHRAGVGPGGPRAYGFGPPLKGRRMRVVICFPTLLPALIGAYNYIRASRFFGTFISY